jgi:hypothetical protein
MSRVSAITPPAAIPDPAYRRSPERIYRNAFSPVSALPTTSVCTSCVPS